MYIIACRYNFQLNCNYPIDIFPRDIIAISGVARGEGARKPCIYVKFDLIFNHNHVIFM